MSTNDPTTENTMNQYDTTQTAGALEAATEAIEHLDDQLETDATGVIHVNQAWDALQAVDVDAVDPAVGERISAALDALEEYDDAAPDEYEFLARQALAELAPLAAQSAGETHRRHEEPTVPVFYNVPKLAADRAIERFNEHREANPDADSQASLDTFIYDEIQEEHVIYVAGEPLESYADGGA